MLHGINMKHVAWFGYEACCMVRTLSIFDGLKMKHVAWLEYEACCMV